MRNAFRIFRRDMKRLLRNPAAILVLIGVSMYQRIVIYTRLFRERWSNNCILSSLWDGTCTGDAAYNPTLGCAFGTDAILFAVGGAFRGR